MGPLYRDREEAGRDLAVRLSGLRLEGSLVLAIPRGGVPIGYTVATLLKSDLDIVVPRKVGAPGEPELAIGAVMHDGSLFLNEGAVDSLVVNDSYLSAEKARQVEEAKRRLSLYRGERPYPELKGRSVIIVDDGIATGATMVVAARWARAKEAKKVIVAAPVAPRDSVKRLEQEADLVVVAHTPEPFYAIGQFYEEFVQVGDEEVISLLKKAWDALSAV